MTSRVLLLVLSLLCLPFCAKAAPIVGDISNYHIEIDTSFNGTRLFLFGARNDNGDVVIVIRGPGKNYIVRKKEEKGGLWVNTKRMKFFNIPSVYAIASSKPFEEIRESGFMQLLGIGEDNLLIPPANPEKLALFDEFSKAFFDHQRIYKLYAKEEGPVQFMGETLFKTTIDFPDGIPSGKYVTEIYLISEGEITGMQAMPINVVKTGLDAFIYNAAHQHPALYGLGAIFIALAAGWIASRIFQK
jgi:uncharacterized protein (TIGR02186 family)